MNERLQLTMQELLPSDYSDLNFMSITDLTELGKNNLQFLIERKKDDSDHIREKVYEENDILKKLEKIRDNPFKYFIKEKPKDFRKCNTCKFLETNVFETSWGADFLSSEEFGATYKEQLIDYCNLFPPGIMEVNKNSDCALLNVPEQSFKNVIKLHNDLKKDYMNEKKLVETGLRELIKISKESYEKPLLPSFRNDSSYISRNEEIIVFSEGEFYEGITLNSPKGMFIESYYLKGGGKREYLNYFSPFVMKKSEFKYLEKNPEFIKSWLIEAESGNENVILMYDHFNEKIQERKTYRNDKHF